MPLSRDTFQKLIDLFTPHFETLDQRRTLVGGAFFGTDVLAKVQLEGTPDEFTTRTVQMLIQHSEVEPGMPAIIHLMQQLRGMVGVDKQAEIDTLIDTIRYELASNPAKPTGKPRVFISYSRTDGEEFATDLRKRLEAESLALWQDRARMEGGVGWWKQITSALDTVEFMVLVATPEAINSPIVKKEWRYARQQGVCVYPVQVPGLPLDFAAMPKWMRDSHFYNLDHEWETFVNYLKAPCTVPKVPFMAPDLPEHFVPRPEKFDPLKRQLLDADFDNPVAITTALKGAGGFGKTTLAAALCHDEDIQTAFDEGVLWVTLGENPNIINKLTVLYRALTDETPGFIEIEEGATKLAEKLVDADVLLVIDDVWNPAHLRPFLRGGERVARLVTTRFSNIAVDANAQLLEVDEMTADESVQMLLAGIEPPDDLTPFKAMAERLGEWALMLEVTNGTLRKRMAKGADLDGALAYVNKALDKRGVAGLKTGSNEAAVQVLDTSIEQVDADEQPRLFELAIFAEDTDVPLTSIMALWDMDDFDTEELIDQFDDLSFVRYDAERGIIRMHDVVREVLASRLDDPVVVHARLVSRYGDLTSLPDEYAWYYISYHLVHAQQTSRLYDLMFSIRFLKSKLEISSPQNLSSDCNYIVSDFPEIRIMHSFWNIAYQLNNPDNYAQLHNQIIGRLKPHEEIYPSIRRLLNDARRDIEELENPSLVLQSATLNPAGGTFERIFDEHSGRITIHKLSNEFIITQSEDYLILRNPDAVPIVSWEVPILPKIRSNRRPHLKIANDGRFLTTDDDNRIELWSHEGTVLATLSGKNAKQLSSGQLISWSEDGTLRLWSSDGELLSLSQGDHKSYSRYADPIELSDGRILTWKDRIWQLWDVSDTSLALDTSLYLMPDIIDNKYGHSGYIDLATELLNGKLLFHVSTEDRLRLYDTDATTIAYIDGKNAKQLSDGRLISWNRDGFFGLWSPNGKLLFALESDDEKYTYGVKAVELSDGRLFTTTGSTSCLRQSDGTPIAVLNGNSILELQNGQLLTWTSGDLYLWEKDGKSVSKFDVQGSINEVLQLKNGLVASLSSKGNDGFLNILRPDGSLVSLLESKKYINDVLEMSDSRLLISTTDGLIQLLNPNVLSISADKPHSQQVNGIIQLRDSRLVSWSDDGTLCIWDVDKRPVKILTGHTSGSFGMSVAIY